MNLAHVAWALVLLGMAFLSMGCQSTPVAGAPTPSPEPSLTVLPTVAPPAPTASRAPATSTTQPFPTPVPPPVYIPITAENAGRLVVAHAIEFGPWSQIISLEWAPDGRFLAVSAGNQLALVDPLTWEVFDRKELAATAPGLAISPNSRYLAAASRDGYLTVWEIGAGDPLYLTEIYSLEVHRKGANRVAFSPDGMWLASGGNDALARVRRVQDGEEVAQIIGGSYAVSDLAFSQDGAWLAVVNSNLIRLRVPESGVMGLTLQSEQPLFCLEFSPDGAWIAAGDSASRVVLWELQKDAVAQVVGEHTGRAGRVEALVWQVDFNPPGDLLASAGGDGAVRIWGIAGREALAGLTGHTGAATSASFSPDGLWLATGDLGGNLRIWGIED